MRAALLICNCIGLYFYLECTYCTIQEIRKTSGSFSFLQSAVKREHKYLTYYFVQSTRRPFLIILIMAFGIHRPFMKWRKVLSYRNLLSKLTRLCQINIAFPVTACTYLFQAG